MASEPRCEPPPGLRDRDGLHWVGVGVYRIWHWDALAQRWSPMQVSDGWSCDPAQVTDNWPFPGKRRYLGAVPDPAALAALLRAAREVLDVMLNEEKPSEKLTIGHAADLHAALAAFKEFPDE